MTRTRKPHLNDTQRNWQAMVINYGNANSELLVQGWGTYLLSYRLHESWNIAGKSQETNNFIV